MQISTSNINNVRLKTFLKFKQFLFGKKWPEIFRRKRLKCEDYLLQSLETAGFQSSELLKLSCMVDTEPMFVDHLKRLIRRLGV